MNAKDLLKVYLTGVSPERKEIYTVDMYIDEKILPKWVQAIVRMSRFQTDTSMLICDNCYQGDVDCLVEISCGQFTVDDICEKLYERVFVKLHCGNGACKRVDFTKQQ